MELWSCAHGKPLASDTGTGLEEASLHLGQDFEFLVLVGDQKYCVEPGARTFSLLVHENSGHMNRNIWGDILGSAYSAKT